MAFDVVLVASRTSLGATRDDVLAPTPRARSVGNPKGRTMNFVRRSVRARAIAGSSIWLRIAILLAIGVFSISASAPQASGDIDVFRAAELGKLPPDWSVSTPGWKAETTTENAERKGKPVKLWLAEPSDAPFGNLLRGLSAESLRGKRVRLDARVRVEGTGHAQMWMRVDRSGGAMGAFDNMQDRPIKSGRWRSARIELDVERDAASVVFGFMAFDGATVYVDAVRMKIVGDAPVDQEPSAPAELGERALDNLDAATRLLGYVRFFHPSDAAVALKSWDLLAVRAIEQVEPAADPADLAARLRAAFASVAPGLEVWAGAPDRAPALPPVPENVEEVAHWKHLGAGRVSPEASGMYSSRVVRERVDAKALADGHTGRFFVVQLPGGVSARLQREVYRDAQGSLPHASKDDARATPGLVFTARNRATRLAGVALAWGVMQHFYPYFDVVECDWPAALRVALRAASTADGELAHLEVLRALIAKLHDGHGGVQLARESSNTLPLRVLWAGTKLVVTAREASKSADIGFGDAIESIDGESIESGYRRVAASISAATEGWSRTRAIHELLRRPSDAAPAVLKLRRPDGREVTTSLASLPYAAQSLQRARERQPDGTEVAPGIVYMNLVGADEDAWKSALPKLQSAKAIVFEMRGYPNAAAMLAIRHLRTEITQSARWCVPHVERPDREAWEWEESGRWALEPLEPHLDVPVAWLTNGSAISYAESIMGIVEAYSLGEIVGATTAGTNGNVNPFELPGGFTVSWTGMKVLKHDGSRHHGVGIRPTIPCEPTPAGIAAGRDDVLEKAVEALKKKLAK